VQAQLTTAQDESEARNAAGRGAARGGRRRHAAQGRPGRRATPLSSARRRWPARSMPSWACSSAGMYFSPYCGRLCANHLVWRAAEAAGTKSSAAVRRNTCPPSCWAATASWSCGLDAHAVHWAAHVHHTIFHSCAPWDRTAQPVRPQAAPSRLAQPHSGPAAATCQRTARTTTLPLLQTRARLRRCG
jgi:hypothetical protein